ncbi:MAG TPA: phosphatase PAP2 family protein [Clostridia bacterium]|nr:phosphatase PAP2 family protein [Clostridia bacterium]
MSFTRHEGERNTNGFYSWTTRRTVLSILSLVVFTVLARTFKEDLIQAVDLRCLGLVYHLRTPYLTSIMRFFTSFGSIPVMTMVLIVTVLMFARRCPGRRYPLVLILAAAGAWGLEIAFKALFQRPRPDLEWLVDVAGYSFPSGHATVAAALYGTLGYLGWQASKGRIARSAWVWGMVFLTIMVGASRVYLGVHYPSDVVAGFALGGIWAIICVSLPV